MYCNSNIELATQPITTLLCNHLVHSYCFLRVMCQDSPRFLHCPLPTCNAPLANEALIAEITPTLNGNGHPHGLTHNQMVLQAQGDVDDDQPLDDNMIENALYQRYNNNAEFREEIKAYHKQVISTNAAVNKLMKLVATRKKQLFTSLQEIKATIKESMKQNISSLKSTDIYKNYMRERCKYLKLCKKLEGSGLNINSRRLYYAFKGKPGFSRWPYIRGWRLAKNYYVKNEFRFRVTA
jgi:hypothetical protein